MKPGIKDNFDFVINNIYLFFVKLHSICINFLNIFQAARSRILVERVNCRSLDSDAKEEVSRFYNPEIL